MNLPALFSPALLAALSDHIRVIVREEFALLSHPPTTPPLLRADKTGLGRRAVNEACRTGRLRGTKIGGQWFVTPTDLAAYVAEHRSPAPTPTAGETPSEIEERVKVSLTEALSAPPKPRRKRRAVP